MFDFKQEAVFCLGRRFSKHKMTGYGEILGGHGSLLFPVYAYDY